MKKTIIIILVWNDYINTKKTIESVLHSKNICYDILIVDNDSTDGCINKLKIDFVNCPNICYLYNTENWGYAEGNNVAFRYALEKGYDYFFVLNNDVTFKSDFLLRRLVDTLEGDSTIGIVAPLIWNRQENGQFTKGTMNTNSRLYNLITSLNGVKNGSISSNLYSVATVSGCFIVFSRKCIERLGGFNRNFFMYGEEDDLCFRAMLAGFKICKLIQNDHVYHWGGSLNFDNIADWKRVLIIRNRMLLLKNFPYWQVPIFAVLNLFYVFKRVITLLRKKSFGSSLISIIAYCEGLYSLLAYSLLESKDRLFTRASHLPKAKRIYFIKSHKC